MRSAEKNRETTSDVSATSRTKSGNGRRGNQRSINRGRNRRDRRRRVDRRRPCDRHHHGDRVRRHRRRRRKPLSSASLTLIVRPSNSVPFISLMALTAFSSFAKVTNPNPRDRPVSRSVITLASAISPNRENAPCRPSSVVSQLNPPTNNFFDIPTGSPTVAPSCSQRTLFNTPGIGGLDPDPRRVAPLATINHP